MDVFDDHIVSPVKIRHLFDKKYDEIAEQLSVPPSDVNDHCHPSIRRCYQRVKNLLDYNTRDGKRTRGLAVVTSYCLIAQQNIKMEDLDVALALGWAVEIMQGSFLVADDIMDQSKTRRKKPCWYKVEGVGLEAVNDSMLLESCVFLLLKKYCSSKPYYKDLLELFREVMFATEIGQSLDMDTSEKPQVDFTCFTDERYNSVIKYKTAFYSFYLPVATALYISGAANPIALEKSKQILTEMGCYFQIQDDFLDCFGDPSVTGKIGTDIEANKCTWLIVEALKKCSQEQRNVLEKNYGKLDQSKKETVVSIYKELRLEECFHQLEQDTYSNLRDTIMSVSELGVPPEVFMELLDTIYMRKK